MTDERRHLELRLEQALRDLLELDQQVADGELSPAVASRLRRDYEREVAEATAELDASPKTAEPERTPRRRLGLRSGRRGTRPRALLYGSGALALVAAALLLPTTVLNRPSGGFVTGNEALQDGGAVAGSTTAGRNLADVTDSQLEAVVAANPEVIGMRIALADRYTRKGRYYQAAKEYVKVVEQDPKNAEGPAHLGWLMLQIDKPKEAARLVDKALAIDPRLLHGLWFKANIQLYGLGQPRAALQTLDVMSAQQNVSAAVRGQIRTLRADATQRIGKPR